MINLLPISLKQMLFSFTAPGSTCCLNATSDLVNGVSVANVLYLAYRELVEVNELDSIFLKRFSDKIRFYNGSNDLWCPLEYVDNLKVQVPDIHVEVCKINIPHAFVLQRANDVANIVSNWHKKILM